MNSLIYLGEIPTDRQSVSELLTARGINYLRTEPSKVVPVVHPSFSLPPYDIYKNNIHAYIRAAHDGVPVLLNDPYNIIETTDTFSFFPAHIPVIISFASRIREEARDFLKQEYRLEDTIARGKPALKGELSYDQMRSLIKDHNPVTTTPTTSSHINLSAAKDLRLMHRIANAFFRLQQYPTVADETVTAFMHNAVDVAIPVDEEADTEMTEDAMSQHWVTYLLAKETKYMAHANLSVPFKTYNPEIGSSSSIPTGRGFCLPYVRDLSLPDYRILPSVIGRYFMGLLGGDAAESQEVFDELKSSWGVICRTEMGFELAHMFWCISLAIETRSQILAIVPSSKKYLGCMIIGDGYSMDIRGRLITPCARSDLVEAFGTLNPHDGALAKIYWMLEYGAAEARIQDRDACKSLRSLWLDIKNHPQRADKTDEIKKLAMQLAFPGSEPLSATAHNVATVLGAIADANVSEDKFPLYPACVVSSSREERLLSAFGAYAPSFLVPGGKMMMLDKEFEVQVGKKSEGNTRNVKKIGYIMKPLEQAVADLDRVRETKGVLNPHGSAIMGRTSANSLIRSADAENAAGIIFALRMYTGTAVSDVVLGKKRSREQEGQTGEGSKRKRANDW